MRFRSLVVGAVLSFLAWAPPAKAAVIGFDSISGLVGTTIDVQITATDQEAFNLLSFGFALTYNPLVLELTGVLDGTVLLAEEMLAVPLVDPPATISIGRSLLGLAGDPVEGSAVLAIVRFTALAAGDGNVSLLNPTDPRSPEDLLLIPYLFDEAFENILTGVSSGVVEVLPLGPTPVPEPSTLALLGIGAAVLARRRRRRP